MAGRRASRNWEREYDESWDDPAMWVDNGGFAGAWNVDSWYDEYVEELADYNQWCLRRMDSWWDYLRGRYRFGL